MKRIGVVGISLLVLFGMSAFASVASAEPPEFGRCVAVAKGTGAFKNSACTTASAVGNYEWMPGPGAANKFSIASTSTLITLFETVAGTKLVCDSESGAGEYTGAKTVGDVLLSFTGCKSSGGQANSPGQPPGHVVFKALLGVLGVEKAGKTPKQDKIGLDLSPEESAGLVSQIAVGGIPIEVRGSVIVPLKSNKMLVTDALKWRETKGKQKPEQFEGVPIDVLETSVSGGPFEQAGLNLEATLTSEEAIETSSIV